VVLTGVGQPNARASAVAELARRRPSLVLSCGFAGGLNPALARNAVVLDADAGFPLSTRLRQAGAVVGRFHCADRILVTTDAKAEVWRETGADAVEMESAVIRSLCFEQRLPSATVRVISDAANESLPLDFNRLSNTDGTIAYGRLFSALLKAPGKVGELTRFRRSLAVAAGALARVLAAGIGAGR
jgi:adenosylhomocysteine nucleosidase